MEDLRQLLEAAARAHPGAHSCIFKEKNKTGTRTYGELCKNAAAAASFLLAHGLTGQRIALAPDPTYQRVAAFWGILFSGNTAVLLPEAPDAALLRDTSALFVSDASSAWRSVFAGGVCVCGGKEPAPGCEAWQTVLKTPVGPLPALSPDGVCVILPSEDASFTHTRLLSLGRRLAVWPEASKVLSLIPPHTPVSVGLSVAAALSYSALAVGTRRLSNGDLKAFAPETLVAFPADCAAAVGQAFAFARARCETLEVYESAAGFFGGKLRQIFAVDGTADGALRSCLDGIGIRIRTLRSDDAQPSAPFGVTPEPPANETENLVVSAASAFFGMDAKNMLASVPLDRISPVQAADFAFNLRVHPQTVYDSPFLFALAKQVKDENYLISPCDRRTDVLLRSEDRAEPASGDAAVLLTGADGFFGAHLLHELLSARRKVLCPVRDRQKFEENYLYYFGRKPKGVRLISGDADAPYFGMTVAQARKYKGGIAAVVHIALRKTDRGPARAFTEANAGSTRIAVDFARLVAAPFVLISDLRVFGGGRVPQQLPDVRATETRLNIGQKYWRDPLVQSLVQAETAAITARTLGLKTAVIRPGTLGPRSSDGVGRRSDLSEAPEARLAALLSVGAICAAADRFVIRLKPVDEAARETAALILSGAGGRVYHLPGVGRRPSEMLKAAGIDLPRIDDAAFEARLRAMEGDPGAEAMLEELSFAADAGDVRILSSAAEAALGAVAEKRDPQNADYFARFLHPDPKPDAQLSVEIPETMSPSAVCRIMDMRLLEPAVTRLCCGEGSLPQLPALLKELRVEKPLIVAEKRLLPLLCGLLPEAAFLSAEEPSVLKTRISDAFARCLPDALVAAGGPALLSAVGVGAAAAGVRRILLPAPLGTGAGVFEADGSFLPDPAALVCDPSLAAPYTDPEIRAQAVLCILNAAEAWLSLSADTFPADGEYAAEAVRILLELSPALAAGSPAVREKEALQLAAVRSASAVRRRGSGLISVLARKAAVLFGAEPASVAVACAPEILRALGGRVGPGLSALAARCDLIETKEKSAETMLSALCRFLSDMGRASALPALRDEDVRLLALETADETRRLPCPQLPAGRLRELIRRIFPGTGS